MPGQMVRRIQRGIGKHLPDSVAWRARHRRSIGRWPDLGNPRRFNEKVIWRELFDRRPVLAELDDKLRGREIARERLPGIRLPEIVWTGTDLTELTDLDLPKRWVLKPNNSTHRVILGEGRIDDVEAATMADETKTWLDVPPLAENITGPRRPWVETRAERCFLVEEFIGNEPDPPPDVKMFVFGGRVELALVRRGPEPDRDRAYFDRDWRRLELTDSRGTSAGVAPPSAGTELIEAAEKLSGGIDFIRVDLYEVEGEVWFGEFTPNPGWGLFRFEPDAFDLELGRRWRLPDLKS